MKDEEREEAVKQRKKANLLARWEIIKAVAAPIYAEFVFRMNWQEFTAEARGALLAEEAVLPGLDEGLMRDLADDCIDAAAAFVAAWENRRDVAANTLERRGEL